MAWEKLVGIPWRDRGASTEGADCWGLVRLAYRTAGVELPDFELSAVRSPQAAVVAEFARPHAGWVPVSAPLPGDVVLASVDGAGGVNHCGVYVGAGRWLHTTARTGAVVMALAHPVWQRRVRGFVRWLG